MTKIWFDIHKNTQTPQKYWFTITTQHDILAHSEMYANKTDCIHAAKIIQLGASVAIIYDETGDVKSVDIKDRMIL